MMQQAGGMMQPPMAPPPMNPQHQMPPMGPPQIAPPQPQQQQQQWSMMAPPPVAPPQQNLPPPQYYQAPPGQYTPPPQPVPPNPVHYQAPPPPAQYQVPPTPVQYQAPPPPPQYQPPIPVQSPVAPAQYQPASADEIKTLWIGDLQYWMDENYVINCFSNTGEVQSVKLIRNKQTGQLEGYGFIEFVTRAAADRVLQTYSGTMMPNIDQTFRLNWASFGAGEKRGGGDDGADYNIFVGDLAADVTDYMLQETFRNQYPSVKGAKVVTDRATGRSKGYGFVRFGDVNEQTRAMSEMHGVFCSSRPMRIGAATTKKTVTDHQQYSTKASYQNTQGTQSDSDPDNTTIFVGGLDSNVSEDELRRLFSTYGELVHVKIPVGKRCGFVQFANRACAEEAKLMLNGTLVGTQNIRLSWGRSPSIKQPQQQDPNQWSGGYYGYGGQGYDAYGYGQPPQDPNMYAYGAYPGYPNYQQQQANYQQQQ